MNNNLTLVNKISLLGLLALLTGTGKGVVFALIFALSLSFIALIIKFIYSINEHFFSQKRGKIILWATGFGVSYFFYTLFPLIFTSQSQHFNHYFSLIGLTPLIYAELENKKITNFIINHTLFFDLMLAVAILRELLGQGSLLNYQLFTKPPLSIAAEAPGAFLILGIVALIYEAVINNFNLGKKIKEEMAVKTESEVQE